MSVTAYKFSLLTLDQCPVQCTSEQVKTLLKAWRKFHGFATTCNVCRYRIHFQKATYFICCGQFYFNNNLASYTVQSIGVPTPGYRFVLPQLERLLQQTNIQHDAEFLVLPDPIYWTLAATFVYEKVMKFVNHMPISNQTSVVLSPSKASYFYNQMLEAPLNYGSLNRRSCGKNTLMRQFAFGKRCQLALRGLIVADGTLSANEIKIPYWIVRKFGLAGKFVVVIRMPSLGPGNTIALRVADDPSWNCPCFGFPLERTESLNADFDGDEVNLYLAVNRQSQAECLSLLSGQMEMSDPVLGLKLAPSQDMMVAYYLYFDKIDFLPYKQSNLKRTFQVLFHLYGSEKTFQYFEELRKFYLRVLQQDTCFALTLQEMLELEKHARVSYQHFEKYMKSSRKPLAVQVASGAKGTNQHVYQMFGSIGFQNGRYIERSFWQGMTPADCVAHAFEANMAMSNTSNIWEPGYTFYKLVYVLQALMIDYLGQLVDGQQVIKRDALSVYHYTEILSSDTFQFLVQQMRTGNLSRLASQLLPKDILEKLEI